MELFLGFFNSFTSSNNLIFFIVFNLIQYIRYLEVFLDYNINNLLVLLLRYLTDSFISLLLIILLFFIISSFFGHSFKFFIFPFLFLDEIIKLDYVKEPVELNSALLNGLLVIHPIMLFSAYAFFFVFLIFILSMLNKFYYSDRVNSSIFYFFYYTILIAIFLGGVWAQQELNWGGWWGWDPVEASSLFIFLFSLYFLHIKNLIFTLNLLRYFYLLIFLFFFSCIRKALFFSIHNFLTVGTNEGYFIYLFAAMFFCFIFPIIYRIQKNLFFNFFIFLFTFLLMVCFKGLLSSYFNEQVNFQTTNTFVFFLYFFSLQCFFNILAINYLIFLPFFFNIFIFNVFFFPRAIFTHLYFYIFLTLIFFFKFDFIVFGLHSIGEITGFIISEFFFWYVSKVDWTLMTPSILTFFFGERLFYFINLSCFNTTKELLYQVDIFTNLIQTKQTAGYLFNASLFSDGILLTIVFIFFFFLLKK